jgi:hypothetical protein
MRFIYISFFKEMIHHSIAMIKRQNKNKKLLPMPILTYL